MFSEWDDKEIVMKDIKKRLLAFLLCLTIIIGTGIADDEPDVIDFEDPEAGITAVLYDNSKGMVTSEATTVIQAPNGFIWVGSYSGLYRYDGREFVKIGTDRRVSSIVSVFMDSKERLWVGTNDNGAAIYKNGEFTFFSKENGMHSDAIRDFSEDDKGNVYIATTEGIAYVNSDNDFKILDNPQIKNEYVMELRRAGDKIYGCTMTGKFFCIECVDDIPRVSAFYSAGDYDIDLNCIFPDPKNEYHVYIGTSDSKLIYASMKDGFKVIETRDISPLNAVNSINYASGNLWLCTDNGIGYINSANELKLLEDVPMTNSVHHVIEDYEGNLWFTSTRQGLMKIVANKFSDISGKAGLEQVVVNSTCMKDDMLYIGTDTGLIILDKNYKKTENELTKYLEGCRIRSIKKDSKGNVWFCTFSEKALVCLKSDGSIVSYNSDNTGLNSNRVRTCVELNSGLLAVSVSGGLHLLNDGKIEKTFDNSNGLNNIEILTICEMPDERVYLGSDGDGMYILERNGNVTHIGKDEGLPSEIIMRVKYDEKLGVYWIISSNSIAYIKDEKITTVSNFPYSNNFDIFTDSMKNVWVFSSNGVYVTESEDMLANKENMRYVHYDKNNGLPCVSTANSRSYLREDGMVFVSGSTGICSININQAFEKEAEVKAAVPSITVDGKDYYVKNGETITIPADAKRVIINAYVLSFSMRNPKISYKLDGFDNDEVISNMTELEKISYTNLDGGSYDFTFSVLDGLTGEKEYTITIHIVKKKAFYEYLWFKILVAFLVIAIIAGLIILYFRKKTRELEKKAKEEKELTNQVITAFAKCIDMKDKYTRGHSFRVAAYTKMIAERMGKFTKDQVEDFYNIALLHDIGKISIPDNVLNKPGRLDDNEFVIMKTHAWNGYEILKEIKIMPDLALGAGYHHERFNGKGYPNGLHGDVEIPMVAQIIAVADSFDAMFTARVYKKKMPLADVVAELERCKGTHYNPEVVDAFLEIIKTGIFDAEEKVEEQLEKELQQEVLEEKKHAKENKQ